MNGDDAIVVENVSKRFRLRMGGRTLKSTALDLLRPSRRHGTEFWALRNISFSVPRGRTLGIIGANGAGKSTLLALLAGTKQPTAGRIVTRGSISSLLELGAGFHPDLTGRENVYLAGAVMGLPREVMRRRFDAVVEFAGIAAFIDQPVKHYSSGMYVRLGFAVAVEVDPEILLIDEVLAVGDIAFQRKCLEKMEEFRQRGKTLLIISHDLGTIESISDQILFLDGGELRDIGSPADMVGRYRADVRVKQSRALSREWGVGGVTLTGAEFYDAAGNRVEGVATGATVEVRVSYRADRRVDRPVFGFSLATDGGILVYGSNTQIGRHAIPFVEGEGRLRFTIGPLTIAPGLYLFSFSVHSADHQVNYHRLEHRFPFTVEGERTYEGAYLPVRWEGP